MRGMRFLHTYLFVEIIIEFAQTGCQPGGSTPEGVTGFKYRSDGAVRTRPHEPFSNRLKCNKEKRGSFSENQKIGHHLVRTIKKRGLLVKPSFFGEEKVIYF